MKTSFFSRLGWKLFFTYIIVIAITAIVLNLTAQLAIPSAFDRHMSGMDTTSTSMMSGGMMISDNTIYSSFESAFKEAITFATIFAGITALIISMFVSNRFTKPILEMMSVSQRISDGNYQERLKIINSKTPDELDQLAISFNQMANNLAQTEDIRRQLIGDVAHELRTPLTIIKGSLEGLIDGILPSNPESYQNIYLETDRMQNLVNDLQELSSIESGNYRLDLQKQSIEEIFKTTLKRLQGQFNEKSVKIITDIEVAIPNVVIDENRMGQVMINLVGNALQYSNSGGEVSIKAYQNGREIIIEIKDSGIGIPEKHQKNIFQRFYRVDHSRSRAHGGSGIGLTITKHIVEAHGGRIWVESDGKNMGSTFFFTLPPISK